MSDINKKIEELKSSLYQEFLNNYKFMYMWDEDYNEKNASIFAKNNLNAFLKLEGPDRLFKSKEECDGIDLTQYLDKIRNQNEEGCLLLAIKDGKVIEEKLFFSDSTVIITINDYKKVGAFELFKKWNDNNCKVLNYHNHVNRIAARPSNTDIINTNLATTPNPIIKKELAKYELTGFEFYDWGIVTEFDFYSELQEKQSVNLLNEYNQVQNELMKNSSNTSSEPKKEETSKESDDCDYLPF